MESLTRHTDYGNEGLTEQQAGDDPYALLAAWITVAEAADIFEPNAMVLSTVGADGFPSSRTVLLKGLNDATSPDVGLATPNSPDGAAPSGIVNSQSSPILSRTTCSGCMMVFLHPLGVM
jgi:hypothetical protein